MTPSTLVLAADYPPQLGGVATYAGSFVAALDAAGFGVRVVTAATGPAVDPVPTRRSAAVWNRKHVKALPLLVNGARECLRGRPDVLVLMKCNHEGIAGWPLSAWTGARRIVVAYGSEILRFRDGPTGPALRRLMRGADRVVACSGYTGRLVVDGLGVDPARVVVVPPVVEPTPEPTGEGLDAVRARYRLQGRRVLLTVARLVKRKGHDMVLRALAALRGEYSDLVYVIAGDGGDRPYLEGLIAELGVGDRVRMIGAVPTAEIDPLYRAADVFVMPSRREGIDVEGFGIAFLEAGLRCNPVVAGDCGGVADAVVDGTTGLLVDPDDWQATAAAIRDLLDHPERARRLGRAGRERALHDFGRDRQVERLRAMGESMGLFGPVVAATEFSSAVAMAESPG